MSVITYLFSSSVVMYKIPTLDTVLTAYNS